MATSVARLFPHLGTGGTGLPAPLVRLVADYATGRWAPASRRLLLALAAGKAGAAVEALLLGRSRIDVNSRIPRQDVWVNHYHAPPDPLLAGVSFPVEAALLTIPPAEWNLESYSDSDSDSDDLPVAAAVGVPEGRRLDLVHLLLRYGLCPETALRALDTHRLKYLEPPVALLDSLKELGFRFRFLAADFPPPDRSRFLRETLTDAGEDSPTFDLCARLLLNGQRNIVLQAEALGILPAPDVGTVAVYLYRSAGLDSASKVVGACENLRRLLEGGAHLRDGAHGGHLRSKLHQIALYHRHERVRVSKLLVDHGVPLHATEDLLLTGIVARDPQNNLELIRYLTSASASASTLVGRRTLQRLAALDCRGTLEALLSGSSVPASPLAALADFELWMAAEQSGDARAVLVAHCAPAQVASWLVRSGPQDALFQWRWPPPSRRHFADCGPQYAAIRFLSLAHCTSRQLALHTIEAAIRFRSPDVVRGLLLGAGAPAGDPLRLPTITKDDLLRFTVFLPGARMALKEMLAAGLRFPLPDLLNDLLGPCPVEEAEDRGGGG